MVAIRQLVLFGLISMCSVGMPNSISAGQLCPSPPPNLSNQHATNSTSVHGEIVTFRYKSQSYPVDIYSAYAPRGTGAGAQYCIRHEATNKSSEVIEKFYWPLAGLQTDFFTGRQHISILTTKPGGLPPSLDDTWIYAFLNGAVKTLAFQKRADSHLRLEQDTFGSLKPLAWISTDRN